MNKSFNLKLLEEDAKYIEILKTFINYKLKKNQEDEEELISLINHKSFNEEIFLNKIKRHRLLAFFYNDNFLKEKLHCIFLKINNLAKKEMLLALKLESLTIEVARLFNKNNIPMIVLKGIPLAIQTTHKSINRGCGDLDIFIDPKNIKSSIKILEKINFKPIAGNFVLENLFWFKYCKFVDNEITLYRRSHLGLEIIDLHWSLTTFKKSLPDFKKLWLNKKTIKLQSNKINILDSENCFIYLCAHAAIDRWSCLRNLIDIYYLYKEINSSINNKVINRKLFDSSLYISSKLFSEEKFKENIIIKEKNLLRNYYSAIKHQNLPYKNYGYFNWSIFNSAKYFFTMMQKSNNFIDSISFLLKTLLPPKAVTKDKSFSNDSLPKIIINRFIHLSSKRNT